MMCSWGRRFHIARQKNETPLDFQGIASNKEAHWFQCPWPWPWAARVAERAKEAEPPKTEMTKQRMARTPVRKSLRMSCWPRQTWVAAYLGNYTTSLSLSSDATLSWAPVKGSQTNTIHLESLLPCLETPPIYKIIPPPKDWKHLAIMAFKQ